jgi:hypothetical protein
VKTGERSFLNTLLFEALEKFMFNLPNYVKRKGYSKVVYLLRGRSYVGHRRKASSFLYGNLDAAQHGSRV